MAWASVLNRIGVIRLFYLCLSTRSLVYLLPRAVDRFVERERTFEFPQMQMISAGFTGVSMVQLVGIVLSIQLRSVGRPALDYHELFDRELGAGSAFQALDCVTSSFLSWQLRLLY